MSIFQVCLVSLCWSRFSYAHAVLSVCTFLCGPVTTMPFRRADGHTGSHKHKCKRMSVGPIPHEHWPVTSGPDLRLISVLWVEDKWTIFYSTLSFNFFFKTLVSDQLLVITTISPSAASLIRNHIKILNGWLAVNSLNKYLHPWVHNRPYPLNATQTTIAS